MPTPGLYVVNASGETVPVATEGGEGDHELLRESLQELPLGDVRPALFDKRAAFLTMDALERQVYHAVMSDEFEVAAEFAEALFMLHSYLPEWTDEYHSVSTEFEIEEEAIGTCMEAVYEWAVENDHSAREWFEDSDSA